jgi:hypothetical protein
MGNRPLLGMGDERLPKLFTLDVGRVGDGNSTSLGDDLLCSIGSFYTGETRFLIVVSGCSEWWQYAWVHRR